MRLPFAILGACLALVACSGGGDDHSAEEEMHENMHTFMLEKLDVAADGIWDNAGYVLTPEGEQSLFPETDAEWDAVTAAANEIARLSEDLAVMEYPGPREDWVQISSGLVGATDVIKDAVSARDKEALFDAGGYLYRVCLSCHERFIVEAEEEHAQ